MQTLGLVFICLVVASCATAFKLVYEDREPKLYHRATGIECPKVSDTFSQDEIISLYGKPCDTELRRKIK